MEVTMIETDTVSSKFYLADDLSLCPECGAVMNQVDRLKDSLYTLIWFKCSKSDCDGQWLQKKPNSRFNGV
jgi:hypothetical protein